jgi:iron complex transport system substrate-binding protein
VRIPSSITRVLPAGPPAAVLLVAVAPQAMIGWTRVPSTAEAPYLPPQLNALPAYGRLTGRGNTANMEVVLQARPDLILDVGSTSATFASLARRTEEQTGIPFVLLDGKLADTPRLLREIGALLSVPDDAEKLAVYAAEMLRVVSERIARIAPAQHVRVYYARGTNGLTTAPAGSLQAEPLALAGGSNVIAAPPAFTGNLVNVSPEDVVGAQPQVIVADDPTFAAQAPTLPGWRELTAVRAGRIHVPPDLPFGWFDAPPSVNRLLGVQWLAKLLYPDAFPSPWRRA